MVVSTTLFVTAVDRYSRALSEIEAQGRLSMINVQREEMVTQAQRSKRTGIKVYFTNLRSPWELG